MLNLRSPSARRSIAMLSLGAIAFGGLGFTAVTRTGPGGRFEGTGIVIESSTEGTMLAVSGLMLSLPPGGGDVPLTNWSWDLVTEERTAGGVTWTEQAVTVIGNWDGHSLTVTQVRKPSTHEMSGPTRAGAEPGCQSVTTPAGVTAINGVVSTSTERIDGVCRLVITAIGPTARLEQEVTQLAPEAHLRYYVRRHR